MLDKEKKGIIYRILKILVFFVFFVIIYIGVDRVVERKESIVKNGEYIREENNFDVIFLGASHVRDGIYPMELWDKYGIFSYNLSSAGSTVGISYWALKNALDYSTPKLVVIDCSRISSLDKVPKKTNFVHGSFDYFPLSANKIRAVFDLLEPGRRVDFLWKLAIYHERWNELTQEDFQPELSIDKGAKMHLGAAIPNEKITLGRSEKAADDTVGPEYLRKTIELCKEKDIEILLVYLPFPAGKSKVKEANMVYDIAKEYGVDYLNFLDMDGIVNYDTDCYDSNSHLNPSGARKVTEFLGAYMQDQYGIEDHSEDVAYTSWNDDYGKYTERNFEIIREQTNLDLELVMHYDKNISTCIYVKNESEILQDERMVKLIKNVSPYVDLTQIDEAVSTGSEYFAIVDNGWCDIWESVDGESLNNLSTTFGSVSYVSKNGEVALFIQNSEENYLEKMNGDAENPDVLIVTINRLTGEIVHSSSYAVTGNDSLGNVVATRVN